MMPGKPASPISDLRRGQETVADVMTLLKDAQAVADTLRGAYARAQEMEAASAAGRHVDPAAAQELQDLITREEAKRAIYSVRMARAEEACRSIQGQAAVMGNTSNYQAQNPTPTTSKNGDKS